MQANQQDIGLMAELFDVQPQAICWLSPIRAEAGGPVTDFEFAYCNEEGLRYLNLSRIQQQGMLLSQTQTVTDDLRQRFFAEMVSVLETGARVEASLFNPALNKYAKVLRTRLRNGVLTIVQDRTEEHRIIQQLEVQTQQLQLHKNLLDNLLAHSPAGISITQVIRDHQGNITDGRSILANEQAIQYAGIDRETYLTQPISQINPGILHSPLYQLTLDTLRTGTPFFTQYYLASAKRWLELSVARMDENHLINVFMDVTATKEAQLRQQKLLEELQRSNQNLEEFAYAASHDLKEPIRKVLFFSDRLRQRLKDKLDPEDLQLFGRLEAANQRMGSLVDDLLSYSQVSQQPLHNQEVDLNSLVQIILEDLELEIQEKKATVQVGNLPRVSGHQRQMQQLLHNLLGNALKYHQPGTPPHIRLGCTTQQGEATGLTLGPDEQQQLFYVLEVCDNGIGFEQKDAERIFHVFQRLHGNTEYRGTGVGLAIARKVVSNHGGYIRATSTPGQGSCFRVYLPAIPVLARSSGM